MMPYELMHTGLRWFKKKRLHTCLPLVTLQEEEKMEKRCSIKQEYLRFYNFVSI